MRNSRKGNHRHCSKTNIVRRKRYSYLVSSFLDCFMTFNTKKLPLKASNTIHSSESSIKKLPSNDSNNLHPEQLILMGTGSLNNPVARFPWPRNKYQEPRKGKQGLVFLFMENLTLFHWSSESIHLKILRKDMDTKSKEGLTMSRRQDTVRRSLDLLVSIPETSHLGIKKEAVDGLHQTAIQWSRGP